MATLDRTAPLFAVLAGLALPLASSPAASAAEVLVTKTVGTALTATDNIDLEPEGENGLIWTQFGGLSVRATGANLETALDLELAVDESFSKSEDDVDLRLNARGLANAELIDRWLFVDASVAAFQALLEPDGAVSSTASSRGNDTADVYVLSVSPYLRHAFGGWAVGELRYTHERVFVDDERGNGGGGGNNRGDSEVNAQSASLDSGRRLNRMKLGVLLEHEDIETTKAGDDSERHTAELRSEYGIVREFSLLGMIGYERLVSDDLIDDPKGPIWYVGAHVRPGPRTDFVGTVGERYERPSVNATLTTQISPRLGVTAAYTTQFVPDNGSALVDTSNIILAPDGTLIDRRTGRPVDPSTIDIGLDSASYISKQFRLGLDARYERDSFGLLVVRDNRQFEVRSDEIVYLVSGSWLHDLSRDLRLGTLVSFRASEDESGPDTETVLGRIELSYDVAENAIASLAYSRAERYADIKSSEYTENAITVGLRLGF